MKQKSKTGRYYIIENDRFNTCICQIWACVHFLLGYIIHFFSFILEIIFPFYGKGFHFQAKVNTLTVKGQHLKLKSFNSERNHSTVNSLFLECKNSIVEFGVKNLL